MRRPADDTASGQFRLILAALACLLTATPASSQPGFAGAVKTKLALDRLQVLGSVLMIAAHPDDENTALLTYMARGRQVRTAYLSLTRGEGGQNLVGPEQGELLGIIRTRELLAARQIDGAEQFFTRAIDFGFSKSAEETLSKWGHEAVLSDVVWNIRRFRPDVIVLIFTGTTGDGHGHHQASAILGKEAFAAAGDPTRFPEQLDRVEPWTAKRLVWNVYYWRAETEGKGGSGRSRVKIDTGEYNPLLGYSYAEIAGMSRSMHSSQGFGSAERRGSVTNFLEHIAGEPASTDIFDGIDLTWNRLPGGAPIGRILEEAARTFDPERPEKAVPFLLNARPLIAAIKNPWATRKLRELDETVALCAGLWLDASADSYNAVPGTSVNVAVEVINRSRLPLLLESVQLEGIRTMPVTGAEGKELSYNVPVRLLAALQIPSEQAYSQPYWLRRPAQGSLYAVEEPELLGLAETPPVLRARIRLQAGGQPIELEREVHHRYVDRVSGEQVRSLDIVPAVAVRASDPVLMFPDEGPRELEFLLLGNTKSASGEIRLEAPKGWRVEPSASKFTIDVAGEQVSASFRVTAPAGGQGVIRAVASVTGREISSGMQVIRYPHIPPQTVFPPAEVKVVQTAARTLARKIGYVMGAGDEVPEAIRQLGCEVTLLTAEELVRGSLSRFDAIVTGVRAFNTRPDLRANFQRLLSYVSGGGTLVVQYNVLPVENVGPFPLKVGRDRVTVEEAPVTFPNSRHPLLQAPNRITGEDFAGWVQERGLYFASGWDSRYEPLFESHDPGDKPLAGGTLYARYGKGAYVFTAVSWFRQLPAGVPGAYRIFANLLSAGRVTP